MSGKLVGKKFPQLETAVVTDKRISGIIKTVKTVPAIFGSSTSRRMPVQQMNIFKLSKLSKLTKDTTVLEWFPLAVAGISDVWPSRKPFQNPSQR